MAGLPTDRDDQRRLGSSLRWMIVYWAAWLVATALTVGAEWWRPPPQGNDAARLWWSGLSPDWLPFIPILLLAVPVWFIRGKASRPSPRWWTRLTEWSGETCPSGERPASRREGVRAFGLSLVVAAVGLLMSWHVGLQFDDLPPAYHDEYSYLFQAETFLRGRVSFASHASMPELFNQMHVLNEGRFASRYFPGTGLWMLPFLALGNPWWGHRLAHSFASFLLFWIGRHVGNNAVGLTAGLLLAVSPGVALFSNLLLAHHPTLVGLLVFLITFLKLRRAMNEGTRLWVWALLAGCGLTFAMLCRPMTAAGVCLPFGIWFVWWVLTGRGSDLPAAGGRRPTHSARCRLRTAAAMGVPLLLGFAGLFLYNRAITGEGLVTPYERYTEIYTPRHVYGFNNVIRGEQRLGPKVLENYDTWAENLTPALAARNVGRRIVSSLRWTLGIVPLVLAGIVLLLTIDRWGGDWWLMAAAILSLHVVHIPYWFEGIMGWHYVFESAPFWLLIFAGVTVELSRRFRLFGRPWMSVWCAGMIMTAVAVNLVTVEPLWPARLDVGVAEVSFPRQKYADFFEGVRRLANGRAALVLIAGDPSDRHMDYVVNPPSLDAAILYGRYDREHTDLKAVVDQFPDRDIWLIDVATNQVQQIAIAREH